MTNFWHYCTYPIMSLIRRIGTLACTRSKSSKMWAAIKQSTKANCQFIIMIIKINNIHYFRSRKVIWSDIRCMDFIFPEPPDNVYQTILPFWSWNNIFVILQILIYRTQFKNGVAREILSFFISCWIWKVFAPLKRSHQRMVHSKWINRK